MKKIRVTIHIDGETYVSAVISHDAQHVEDLITDNLGKVDTLSLALSDGTRMAFTKGTINRALFFIEDVE